MKMKMLKAGSVAAIVTFGALAAGCASTGGAESTKAMAKDAQTTSQQALQTAQQANETATEAKRMAADAQSTANQAMSTAQQNSQRMNRMYMKGQRK